MASIERRITEMEHKKSVGAQRYRFLHVGFENPEDRVQAQAEAIARDEAEHGPLQPHEQYIVIMFGPSGHWIETETGPRWKLPNGTIIDEP